MKIRNRASSTATIVSMRRGVGLLGLSAIALAACSLFTDLGGFQGGEDEAPVPPVEAGTTTDAPLANETGTDVAIAPAFKPRFKRTVVITNVAATTLSAGHTVCMVVSSVLGNVNVRPDLGDVRFFGPNGSERDRAIDRVSSSTMEVCFRLERPIASNGNDAYEVRYGDPAATPPTNDPSLLFAFYDGFDGTAIAPKWSVQGTVNVAGGVLVLPKGAETVVRTLAANDGVPAVASLELRVRVQDPSSASFGTSGYFYWFGFQRKDDFFATSPWTLFIARDPNIIAAEQQIESFEPDAGTCAEVCSMGFGAQTADFRIYRIDRNGGTTTFRLEGEQYTANADNGDLGIVLRSSLVTSDVEVDWVRARPLVLPEPTVVFGSETPL